jgi:O-antigen ligase
VNPADPSWTTPELVAACAAVAASAGGLLRALGPGILRSVGLALLVVGWLGLIGAVAPAGAQARWPALIVIAIGAVAAGWFVARPVLPRTGLLLVLGAAVLVLRVPVPTGDGTSMLLAPLYVVTALGAIVLLRQEIAELQFGAPRDGATDRGRATRLVDIGVAAYPALATVSILWSIDRSASIEQLAFFLVPFQLVYAQTRAWVRTTRDIVRTAIAYVSVMLIAAVVGIYQAATHTVWWNAKVIDSNRFRPDFRTNSLFFDPNVYGRALVLALLVLVAWAMTARLTRGRVVGASVGAALLVTALWFTYSQSSWFALASACIVIAILTLPPRARRWAAAAIAVLVIAALPVAAHELAGDDASGRAHVIKDGIQLAQDRPVHGWGVGTFQRAAIRQAFAEQRHSLGLVASHTTPVTVVAELGALGVVSYLLLLTGGIVAILARWRVTSAVASEARADGVDTSATGWPAAPIVFATGALIALVAHSLLYAGFFEDASLWASLALVASLPAVVSAD